METHSSYSKILPSYATDRPIGEILVKAGKITLEQLNEAIFIQNKSGGRIGWIIMSLGWISRLDFFQSLADHYHLSFYQINHKILKIISIKNC